MHSNSKLWYMSKLAGMHIKITCHDRIFTGSPSVDIRFGSLVCGTLYNSSRLSHSSQRDMRYWPYKGKYWIINMKLPVRLIKLLFFQLLVANSWCWSWGLMSICIPVLEHTVVSVGNNYFRKFHMKVPFKCYRLWYHILPFAFRFYCKHKLNSALRAHQFPKHD